MVAFAIPLWLMRGSSVQLFAAPAGVLLIGVGTALLLWCVRDFYVLGRGTLAPWAPPRRLLQAGAYRFTRNPMYVAVILILIGWAALFASRALALYAGCVALLFHVRVVAFEEPTLARAHPQEWPRYQARVRRWL